MDNLVVEFGSGRRTVHAVSGISLDIMAGETLGLVGESGCGKSTTGRAIIQLPRPTSGTVRFAGEDLTELSRPRPAPLLNYVIALAVLPELFVGLGLLLLAWADMSPWPVWLVLAPLYMAILYALVRPRTGSRLREVRRNLQLIFQDPISSLNPRRRVSDILAEPLRIWQRGTPEERDQIVRDTLETVGLDPDSALDKRPHQFSGGQCQRISIARALVMEPKLIICDEPVSALDVSVQAQILNLLEDLKARYGLTLVFIAHDLAVVKSISDRVAVMYLGKLCEVGPPDTLYEHPAHPYTAALLASIPVPDPTIAPHDDELLSGDLPSPLAPPSGCRFRTRCPRAQDRCTHEEPQMRDLGGGRYVACHFPLQGPDAPATPVDIAAGSPA
jgi:peptide/nickel transport system ATP-binding protein